MFAVVLFAIAAVGGLYLASRHFRGSVPPLAIGLVHATLGAAGLITLLLTLDNSPLQLAALVVLVLAALGGFFLFSFRLRKVAIPKPLILVHAGVAVAGFVLLCVSVFRG